MLLLWRVMIFIVNLLLHYRHPRLLLITQSEELHNYKETSRSSDCSVLDSVLFAFVECTRRKMRIRHSTRYANRERNTQVIPSVIPRGSWFRSHPRAISACTKKRRRGNDNVVEGGGGGGDGGYMFSYFN